MTNSISNMLNSRIRMSGLSSGIDTDSMIKQILAAQRFKIDKVKQDKQLLEWKRNDYRDITNSLRAFRDEYFDVLKPSTNFRSASAFASFNISSSDETIATATASAGALSKSHTLKVEQLAEKAYITGTSPVTSAVNGSIDISDLTLQGKQIKVKLDGVEKTIDLEDYASMADLETKLEAKFATAFGANKLNVVVSGNKIEIQTVSAGSTFSISEATNDFISKLGFSNAQQNYLTGTDVNTSDYSVYTGGKFKITLNGSEQEINIDNAASIAELTTKIQAEIDTKFGGTDKIKVENNGSKLTFTVLNGQDMTLASGSTNNVLDKLGFTSGAKITGTSSADIDISGNEKGKTFTISINGAETTIEIDQDYASVADLAAYINGQIAGVTVTASGNKLVFDGNADEKIIFKKGPEDSLTKLGFAATDNTSNRVSLHSNLNSIENYFTNFVDFTATNTVQFTINGVSIDVGKTFENATITDVMNAVNTSSAGVEMTYDSLNDKFMLLTKETGAAQTITYSDTSGLFTALGIAGGTLTNGKDAVFELDLVAGMTRSTNEFTIDGVTYNLKKADNTKTITIDVNADADKLVEKIKGFVNKYNEVIGKINGKLVEKRDRSYLPLTDEQREAMSESDIEKWEEKAKTGLLRSDSILNSITYSMRLALSDTVEGSSTSLAQIGITTGSYDMRGMLVIDETKLKEAINNDSNAVVQLFTQESQYSYNEAINDSSKRTTRYNESGLAQRLYDIIQDNIRTTRNESGQKGILLEKAGITGDISEFQNVIADSIKEKDSLIDTLLEKLTSKEDALYAKFTAMERALSAMNSQSSWLSQQTGGQ
ncbi:MAG: flagellar filament capping protein FliD [Bacillota bacterium]